MILKHSAMLAVLWLLGSAWAAASRVDTVSISTANIISPAKAVVVTPDIALNDTVGVPTVYLLHGHSGRYDDWIKHMPQVAALADDYGIVIVMPDGRNSWYFDSPRCPQMQMESFFVEDLVPYIDSHYPTLKDARQRAITGLSMGGHGAMWLGMRHPEIWGSAATMSGGVDIRPFPKYWNIKDFLGNEEAFPTEWETHTVVNLVLSLTAGKQHYLIDCGIDDFFSDVNLNLHKAMVDAKIPHDYVSRPGQHTWNYWRRALPYHLMFFKECFGK